MLLDVAFGLLEVKKVKARRQRRPKRKGRKANHSRWAHLTRPRENLHWSSRGHVAPAGAFSNFSCLVAIWG